MTPQLAGGSLIESVQAHFESLRIAAQRQRIATQQKQAPGSGLPHEIA